MMLKKLLIYVLFGLSACSHAPKKVELPQPPAPRGPAPEELMYEYQGAFEAFWDAYDPKINAEMDPIRTLYLNMGWAKIGPDSSIMAIASGHPKAIFAIYTADNPELKKWFPTYQSSVVNDWPVILIRPDRVSKVWSPIFLIHELSHMWTILNHPKMDPNEDEVRAYIVEKLAVNSIRKFQLDVELDNILRKAKVRDEKEILKISSDDLVPLIAAMDKKLFAAEKPASTSESEMRLGFYLVALGLRQIENQKLTPAARMDRMKEYWKAFRVFAKTS